ncbi:hypothetical protein WT12_08220 [Burkholderia territorii]|nr:hypothetical protein WT12_08220 [Burkholderia territorii]
MESTEEADVVANAERLHVRAVSVNCPHCGVAQEGWIADPRDRTHECDDCGASYRVPADVQLAF